MTKEERAILEQVLAKLAVVEEKLSELGAYLAADKVRIEHLECDVRELQKETKRVNDLIARTAGAVGIAAFFLSTFANLIARYIWR